MAHGMHDVEKKLLECDEVINSSQEQLNEKSISIEIPGIKYKKSIISDGIVYSETSANGKEFLVAKKFTKGACAGGVHCAMISSKGTNHCKTVALDNPEVHYKRLMALYQKSRS